MRGFSCIKCDFLCIRATDFDWKEAEWEFRRSLEIDPKSEEAWIDYAYSYLMPLHRLDDAVAAWKSALEPDPLSPVR